MSRRRSTVARRRAARRRRFGLLAGILAGVGLLALFGVPSVDRAVQEVTFPLRYEDVIRQQAEEKRLDPALIAGVIYAESKFRDQTSPAGARGLMQITPQTARYIARLSGGTAFEQADLATPQWNITYGSYYLRYLLDRYDGNLPLALAAYNGGEGNVDRWLRQGIRRVADIPFPETRAYVDRVLDARREYARKYARELGL